MINENELLQRVIIKLYFWLPKNYQKKLDKLEELLNKKTPQDLLAVLYKLDKLATIAEAKAEQRIYTLEQIRAKLKNLNYKQKEKLSNLAKDEGVMYDDLNFSFTNAELLEHVLAIDYYLISFFKIARKKYLFLLAEVKSQEQNYRKEFAKLNKKYMKYNTKGENNE